MGTRHLICVYHKGRFVIAQIGLHNGDPHVMGVHILEFIASAENIDDLRAGLQFIKIYEGDDPEFCLNHQGSVVLKDVAKAGYHSDEIELVMDLDFASDSVMCSWVYVVDLDGGVFEIYMADRKGDSEKITDQGRLSEAEVRGQLFTASFELADLHDEDEFMRIMRLSYGQ
jgi:hypothetical protein